MFTWIYRAIALMFVIFAFRDFWKEVSPAKKITACMVMVPLTLRVLMIK